MDHSLDIRTDKVCYMRLLLETTINRAAQGELVAKLQDKNKISAVQSVVTSHPRRIQRLATGNASGRCVLWGPKENETDEEE